MYQYEAPSLVIYKGSHFLYKLASIPRARTFKFINLVPRKEKAFRLNDANETSFLTCSCVVVDSYHSPFT